MFKYLNFLILLAIVACSCSSKEYKFSGTISGVKAEKVYLERSEIGKLSRMDSSVLTADGTFAFSGSIDEPSIVRLFVNNRVFWWFFLEEGSFEAQFDAGKYQFEITNSPESKEMVTIVGRNVAYINRYMQLKQQNAKAKNSGDAGLFQKSKIQLEMHIANYRSATRAYIDTASSRARLFAYSMLDFEKDFDYIQKRMLIEKGIFGDDHRAISLFEQMLEKMAEKVAKKEAIEVGKVAPNLQGMDPSGKTRSLSDLRGKVVLLDFWASWCGPCRRENPSVVKLYKTLQSKGFEIFSVSLDDKKDAWVNAIAQDNLSWANHISDLKGWKSSHGDIYNVNSIPFTVLIDQQGKIIATNLRGAELVDRVNSLLND